MKEKRIFVERADFEEYLSSNPEVNSTLIVEHPVYQVLDVGNVVYFNFEPLILKFRPLKTLPTRIRSRGRCRTQVFNQ